MKKIILSIIILFVSVSVFCDGKFTLELAEILSDPNTRKQKQKELIDKILDYRLTPKELSTLRKIADDEDKYPPEAAFQARLIITKIEIIIDRKPKKIMDKFNEHIKALKNEAKMYRETCKKIKDEIEEAKANIPSAKKLLKEYDKCYKLLKEADRDQLQAEMDRHDLKMLIQGPIFSTYFDYILPRAKKRLDRQNKRKSLFHKQLEEQ